MTIPFNVPHISGREAEFIEAVMETRQLAGGGAFTERCERWLQERTGCKRAFLTPSCTAALELAILLADIGPGDEVIMPSFTVASMANAVVLRGGVPVFIDIRRDTLNMDETLIESAIGSRTKAIMPMHYGGVSCAMDEIAEIAERAGLAVIEDAAHALLAEYHGRSVGSMGQAAALSFQATKNIVSGEGGALLVCDEGLVARAEILREKGTNRAAFFRGEVAKYTWIDIGSSYLPGELIAAFLLGQFEHADSTTDRRRSIWRAYHEGLADLEAAGFLRRPQVPDHCRHNGHLYYILLPDAERREAVTHHLRVRGITAPFHYVPLHSAPAGCRYGRTAAPLPVTEDVAPRLLRLPIWPGMEDQVDRVIEALSEAVAPGRSTPGASG